MNIDKVNKLFNEITEVTDEFQLLGVIKDVNSYLETEDLVGSMILQNQLSNKASQLAMSNIIKAVDILSAQVENLSNQVDSMDFAHMEMPLESDLH
jgi:hypothetical protein